MSEEFYPECPSTADGHSMASAMACKGHGRAQACCWHRQTSHARAGGPTTLRRRCSREAQINSASFRGLMRGLHSSSWHCPHYSNAIPDCFSSQGQTRGVRWRRRKSACHTPREAAGWKSLTSGAVCDSGCRSSRVASRHNCVCGRCVVLVVCHAYA